MIINVRVVPNAKSAEVTRDGDGYKVRVDARAEDGKANARLLEILGEYFGVNKSSVSIVKGFTSRRKVVQISSPVTKNEPYIQSRLPE